MCLRAEKPIFAHLMELWHHECTCLSAPVMEPDHLFAMSKPCFVRICCHMATRLCDPASAITGKVVRHPFVRISSKQRRSFKPPE